MRSGAQGFLPHPRGNSLCWLSPKNVRLLLSRREPREVRGILRLSVQLLATSPWGWGRGPQGAPSGLSQYLQPSSEHPHDTQKRARGLTWSSMGNCSNCAGSCGNPDWPSVPHCTLKSSLLCSRALLRRSTHSQDCPLTPTLNPIQSAP